MYRVSDPISTSEMMTDKYQNLPVMLGVHISNYSIRSSIINGLLPRFSAFSRSLATNITAATPLLLQYIPSTTHRAWGTHVIFWLEFSYVDIFTSRVRIQRPVFLRTRTLRKSALLVVARQPSSTPAWARERDSLKQNNNN